MRSAIVRNNLKPNLDFSQAVKVTKSGHHLLNDRASKRYVSIPGLTSLSSLHACLQRLTTMQITGCDVKPGIDPCPLLARSWDGGRLQSWTKVLTHLSKTNAFYPLPSVISENIFFCRKPTPLFPFQSCNTLRGHFHMVTTLKRERGSTCQN